MPFSKSDVVKHAYIFMCGKNTRGQSKQDTTWNPRLVFIWVGRLIMGCNYFLGTVWQHK
jgi:hypothetical protein